MAFVVLRKMQNSSESTIKTDDVKPGAMETYYPHQRFFLSASVKPDPSSVVIICCSAVVVQSCPANAESSI